MAYWLTSGPDLDRSNIGNARTMPQSIDAVLGGDSTGALFNWISTYILFDVADAEPHRKIASIFYFSYVGTFSPTRQFKRSDSSTDRLFSRSFAKFLLHCLQSSSHLAFT